jgi:hypothetical protein
MKNSVRWSKVKFYQETSVPADDHDVFEENTRFMKFKINLSSLSGSVFKIKFDVSLKKSYANFDQSYKVIKIVCYSIIERLFTDSGK